MVPQKPKISNILRAQLPTHPAGAISSVDVTMAIFLDLTAANPLDILLSTQKTASSAVIRIGQTVRNRRRASHSHVALLLSNSVIVESITKGGTVLSNLAGPEADGSDTLHCRLLDGEVRVYARLPAKSAAVLLRHNSIDKVLREEYWPGRAEVDNKRARVLEVLIDVYLSMYSNPARLLRSLVDLPPSIQTFLEHAFGADRAKRRRAGPFCSELVGLLMAEVTGETTDHVKKAPTHFEGDGSGYLKVEDSVFVGEESDLPGSAYASWLAPELVNLLRSARIDGQELMRKVVEVFSLLPPVAAYFQDRSQSRLSEWEQIYEAEVRQLRGQWLHSIEDELRAEVDGCWKWLKASNDCRRLCPGGDAYLRRRRIRNAARCVISVGLQGQITRDPNVCCVDAIDCTVYRLDLEDMKQEKADRIGGMFP